MNKILLSKTPLRVSLFGGRTDLKHFYKHEYGFVVNATINKYIYISLQERIDNKIGLYYLNTVELVNNIQEIQHPIIKECLKIYPVQGINLYIYSDVPSGSGLGSSSCLTVGLINLLSSYKGTSLSKYRIAELACFIEIDKLKYPIGKQDQFACAYGGLNTFSFFPNEEVIPSTIKAHGNNKDLLNNNLHLFFTNIQRNANEVMLQDKINIITLQHIKYQAQMIAEKLQKEKLDNWFGEELHKEWMLKKTISTSISNDLIDNYYQQALNAKATGGKLLGAGGGGFLLFYCDSNNKKHLQAQLNLNQLNFKLENQGTKIFELDDKKSFIDF